MSKPYKRTVDEAAAPAETSKAKVNPNFKRSPGMESFMVWFDWFCNDLPPGPAFLPMRYYINLHKGGMPILIFGLMLYYDNFSLACWLYLALHGSYGLFWLLKDYTFPDASF